MDRNEWGKRNKGEYQISSTRKRKNKDDFDPDSDFIGQAMSDFLEKGGKITRVVNKFVEY